MSVPPARILIVDDTALNLKVIGAALAPGGYELDTAASGREALNRAALFQPDLIILDVMMPDFDGYEACRRLRHLPSFGQRPILMLTANDSLEERVQGLEAGADDYMCKPFQPAELQARVKALLRRVPPAAGAPLTAQGRTIACFSLRGGAGVSTLATNLAAGLAQLWGGPAALVDLALTSGQCALMLNLPLRATWADLATDSIAELDAELLGQVLMSHPSGVRVLAAAARPEQSELITGEHVRYVLGLLRARHAYTVLDLPHDFSETTLAGLDQADEVLLILAPEIASVRAASCALGVFDQLDYRPEKITLVLNTTADRGALGRKEMEAALRRTITYVLPYAPEIYLSALNRGVPPVLEQAGKPLGSVLERWAFQLSAPAHRAQRPASPTPAWQRVAQASRAAR